MAAPEYSAVFIKKDTHKELKILAVTEGRTFDELITKLINYYQANKS